MLWSVNRQKNYGKSSFWCISLKAKCSQENAVMKKHGAWAVETFLGWYYNEERETYLTKSIYILRASYRSSRHIYLSKIKCVDAAVTHFNEDSEVPYTHINIEDKIYQDQDIRILWEI